MQSGGIVDSRAGRLTIQTNTGETSINFPDGLTAAHYQYFTANHCSIEDQEQGLIAKVVLENMLTFDWFDWDVAIKTLRKKHGDFEEDWLPEMVSTIGFDAIAEEMRLALAQERKLHPRPRTLPAWDLDEHQLKFGKPFWTFKSNAVIQISILNAMQKNRWRSAKDIQRYMSAKDELRPATGAIIKKPFYLEQPEIRDACHQLNEKTKGLLKWRWKGMTVYCEQL